MLRLKIPLADDNRYLCGNFKGWNEMIFVCQFNSYFLPSLSNTRKLAHIFRPYRLVEKEIMKQPCNKMKKRETKKQCY